MFQYVFIQRLQLEEKQNQGHFEGAAVTPYHINLCAYVCMLAEMIHDWELYSVHEDVEPEVIRRNTNVAQEMVMWMRNLDLSPQEPRATDESTEAHDCKEKHLTLSSFVCVRLSVCTS